MLCMCHHAEPLLAVLGRCTLGQHAPVLSPATAILHHTLDHLLLDSHLLQHPLQLHPSLMAICPSHGQHLRSNRCYMQVGRNHRRPLRRHYTRQPGCSQQPPRSDHHRCSQFRWRWCCCRILWRLGQGMVPQNTRLPQGVSVRSQASR